MRKVVAGEKLRIPASTWNAMIDAAEAQKAGLIAGGAGKPATTGDSCVVHIRNDSGADRARFDVLGIDEPIFSPADDEDAFKNQVALACVTPDEDNDKGSFVILLEPIAAGEIGRACIAGVCPVVIDVQDEGHKFAEVVGGECGYLQSADAGSTQILWKDSGTGWAVVKLGNQTGPTLPSNADKTKGMALSLTADNDTEDDDPGIVEWVLPLPTNANKKRYMVLQLSADATEDNDPDLWTIDYVRAHG